MTQRSNQQCTIAREVCLSGRGLFSGQAVNLCFKPAPDDHGIVFVRTDLNGARLPALVTNVARRPRRSALRVGEATVEMIEHCMSALMGLGIDNVTVEVDAVELPGADGSAQPYVETLQQAGIAEGTQPRRKLVLEEPVEIRVEDMTLVALPRTEEGMSILYELDYASHPAIGRQLGQFTLGSDDFAKEIAPSRTFVLEEEAAALRAAGMGTHLTEKDVLVLGPDGPMGGNALRFAVVTERMIREGVYLQNVKRLAQFARHPVDAAFAEACSALLCQSPQQTLCLSELAASMSPEYPAHALSRIYRLLYHRHLAADLDRALLDDHTPVTLPFQVQGDPHAQQNLHCFRALLLA
ncbi:MAG: UDP-3-O-acyl-N-acetylglucosamine deacetylase [Blastochloris sp.]|nr:UDP-3-O-acyl-N-acetylglucosamine deacetylase [Blastochloris sp.]